MMQSASAPLLQHQEFTLPPVYLCDLERTIGILQQLQRLCLAPVDVSLSDVIKALQCLEHEFGSASTLEQIIQALVGKRLREQQASRRVRHSVEAYGRAEEVLA